MINFHLRGTLILQTSDYGFINLGDVKLRTVDLLVEVGGSAYAPVN